MTADKLRLTLKGVLMIASATQECAIDVLERVLPDRKPPQPETAGLFVERRKAA